MPSNRFLWVHCNFDKPVQAAKKFVILRGSGSPKQIFSASLLLAGEGARRADEAGVRGCGERQNDKFFVHTFLSLLTALLLPFVPGTLSAQIKPLNSAALNYNEIMFEHPSIRGASGYIIQIANDSLFTKPFVEVPDSFNAVIVPGLKFGQGYYWRYKGIFNHNTATWFGPYSFSILPDPYKIDQNVRVHVLENDSAKNAGGLISIDEFYCIFNRAGQLVWFMPEVKSGFRKDAETFDLTLTPAGTITTITGENGLEMNLEGKVLWMTPFAERDSLLEQFGTFYNHDFKRLANGHYMIIERRLKWKKIPEDYDIYKIPFYMDTATWHQLVLWDGKPAYGMRAGFFLRRQGEGIYMLVNMAGIVEFDKNDSIVWQWDAAQYIEEKDFLPPGANMRSVIREQEPRLNGFCVDSQNRYVYASFRNLNRIVKIEKSTGEVVHSWGSKLLSGQADEGDGFFHKQHSPELMGDGNIVVFNNGDLDNPHEPASVVLFSQSARGEPSNVLWKYDCLFDSVMARNKSSRAGNADPLPNGDLLVCMGSVNRVFEVTPAQKIVWNALLQAKLRDRKNITDSLWLPRPVYRVHYSSSLYPCYFTIEADCDTLPVSRNSFELTINNAGTEADSYQVLVTSPHHGSHKVNTGEIPKRKRVALKINLSSRLPTGERLEVSVQSNANPDFARKLEITCK